MKRAESSKGVFITLNNLLRRTGKHRSRISLGESTKTFNKNESGQTIVLVGLILFTLALLFILVVDTGHEVTKRFFIQNSADAAALTGASWQARILNVISLINIVMAIILALIIVLNAILKALEIATDVLLGISIGLAVCCVIPYTAEVCCPAAEIAENVYDVVNEIYQTYKEIAEPIMDALWDILEFLSDAEDIIVGISPYIPPVMANVVAYQNAKFEDPNVSVIDFDPDTITNTLSGFNLNSLGAINIGSLVVCWPLPPTLPLKEGGLSDVCNEVRDYVRSNWTDPLKKYGIGYILDPIIQATISVTCEGGSGDYTISGDDLIASGCTGGERSCTGIRDAPKKNITKIEWVKRITYHKCTKRCKSCCCSYCNKSSEYSSENLHTIETDETTTNIPPISGSYFTEAFSKGDGCGWERWSSATDFAGDDDNDLAFNEDPINGVDDDHDGRVDEDYIVYLCKREAWYMIKCHYTESGTAQKPPGTSEHENKVQPYILKDDWRDHNAVFYFTHFEKGEAPLLPKKFKSPIREAIGSNAFATSTFFCGTTNINDCDMFHINWKSKLVRVKEDSSLLSGMPSFLQDIVDNIITH